MFASRCDQQRLLRAVAAQRLEHRIDEQVLHLDVGQVAGDERLVVLPQRSVISETALLEISSSPVASRNASSTSRVDSPRAYISLTSDSSTSLLPSRKL